MATEEGVIIKLNPGTAWVKTTKTSACESCSARSGCHTLGGGNEMEVEVVNTFNAQIGDRVMIELKNASLFKASFFLYIFPILFMISGAALGQSIGPACNINSSVLSAVCAFLFLAFSFILVRFIENKITKSDDFRPKILKIL